MTWQTEYPTIATVNHAHEQTLQTWSDNLPAPQTDVERTIRKRIDAKLFEISAKVIREKAPDVADKFNEMTDLLDKMGIPNPGKM